MDKTVFFESRGGKVWILQGNGKAIGIIVTLTGDRKTRGMTIGADLYDNPWATILTIRPDCFRIVDVEWQ